MAQMETWPAVVLPGKCQHARTCAKDISGIAMRAFVNGIQWESRPCVGAKSCCQVCVVFWGSIRCHFKLGYLQPMSMPCCLLDVFLFPLKSTEC